MLLLACVGVLMMFRCAQAVSSNTLLSNPKQYDGKTIVYRGEVVGEVMRRGDFCWINVHDGENAIGVWVPKELANEIIYSGDYRHRGDWVEISGVMHRSCVQHGGDLDIHAKTLKRLYPGRPLHERLHISKRNLVFLLSGMLVLVWFLGYGSTRRKKRTHS
jgi:hypothetical protein